MSTRTAPCVWPVSYAGCATYAPYASLPASGQHVWEQMATEYLWRWTGKSLGVCPVTVRPCRNDCTQGVNSFNGYGPVSNGGFGSLWRPVIINGLWYNISCGMCGDECGCLGGVPALRLPGPIDTVTSVIIDGTTLAASKYRVDNKDLLVRSDGVAWPKCQDMDQPLGQPGTFGITYNRGVPVPVGGQVAAGALAVELFKAACNDPLCGLPKRIQTITRQGVTIAMIDNFSDVTKGATGIWLIDSWISSMTEVPRRAQVYSPDMRRGRITTTPAGP